MDERAWLIDYTCRDPAKIWTDERGTYRESLDDLTPPQKIYLLVWGLEAEVINGGFEQFVGNSTGDTAELVPSALWSIEAYACAALVERALRTLTPDPLPTESDARNELLGRRFEAVFATLRELDKAFYAEPDDLAHLLFKFIHAHPDDFGLAEK